MYPFYLELEMYKPVYDFFKNKGCIIKKEVRIGYHIADIVAFKGDLVTAVELKLKDWKKAIIQAKNYQLGADYVYIAFPLMKSYNILRKAEYILKNQNIGLLTINEQSLKVSEIIKANKSKIKFGTLKLEEVNKKKNRKNNLFHY